MVAEPLPFETVPMPGIHERKKWAGTTKNNQQAEEQEKKTWTKKKLKTGLKSRQSSSR